MRSKIKRGDAYSLACEWWRRLAREAGQAPSLRGIKESPPYLHDGRLLTLEDTVEIFNLVLELKLNAQEKTDLVAFMRAL